LQPFFTLRNLYFKTSLEKGFTQKRTVLFPMRISTQYEKLALTFLNFILVAAVFDWLKSI
jgi:hypothetical protein